MKKSDKKILVFYVCLGISLLAAFSYFDSLYERPHIDLQLKTEPIKNKNFENIINTVPPTSMYEVITDVENYPIVLPKNILSVKILDRTNNSITAEEKIREHIIQSTLTVKHSFVPMEKHTIEILDGDAKGTIITQNFEILPTSGSLKITTDVELDLKGIFSFVGFLPTTSIQHAVDTTIAEFAILAAKKSDLSENELAVELLYREVLLRPADPAGMKFYLQMLEEGQMTIDDIKNSIMKSDEYQTLLVENIIGSINEFNPETIKTIDDVYLEILGRVADHRGMYYYGSLLESGEITIEELRQELLDSVEYSLKFYG